MAISIDDVYQKVLALSNKEQRGYVTPQEFNLMANKAQREIYDNYFHDLKTAYHKNETNMVYADEIDIINEKLHPFKKQVSFTVGIASDNLINLPASLYKINSVHRVNSGVNVELVEMDDKDILYTENNPLTKATVSRPIYVRRHVLVDGLRTIRVYPTITTSTEFIVNYFDTPKKCEWSYIVVNGKALYNSSYSVNFELHNSEEENLVSRILQLAGIIIMKPGIVEIGAAEKASAKTEQNN